MHECRHPEARGIGSPGAGITDSCELPDMVSGSATGKQSFLHSCGKKKNWFRGYKHLAVLAEDQGLVPST